MVGWDWVGGRTSSRSRIRRSSRDHHRDKVSFRDNLGRDRRRGFSRDHRGRDRCRWGRADRDLWDRMGRWVLLVLRDSFSKVLLVLPDNSSKALLPVDSKCRWVPTVRDLWVLLLLASSSKAHHHLVNNKVALPLPSSNSKTSPASTTSKQAGTKPPRK